MTCQSKIPHSDQDEIKGEGLWLTRALREAGLGACVQQKKPLLAKKHVLARLSFAHKYKIGPLMIGDGSFSVMRQRLT